MQCWPCGELGECSAHRLWEGLLNCLLIVLPHVVANLEEDKVREGPAPQARGGLRFVSEQPAKYHVMNPRQGRSPTQPTVTLAEWFDRFSSKVNPFSFAPACPRQNSLGACL